MKHGLILKKIKDDIIAFLMLWKQYIISIHQTLNLIH